MSFSAGVCPRCKDFILQKDGIPFLLCPLCEQSISARESAEELDTVCANAKKTNEVVAKCLKLEQLHGPELPFKILTILAHYFPFNEEIAYLLVVMSDYSAQNVKTYLTKFAEVQKKVSFAVEFLENAMVHQNMSCVKLFEQYIENKLAGNELLRWKRELQTLKAEYKGKSDSPLAKKLLFAYYIFAAAMNCALAAFFVLGDANLLSSVFLLMGVFTTEVGLLFWHNRKFGNRVEIMEMERLFMVIFMCSLVVSVGSAFFGVII